MDENEELGDNFSEEQEDGDHGNAGDVLDPLGEVLGLANVRVPAPQPEAAPVDRRMFGNIDNVEANPPVRDPISEILRIDYERRFGTGEPNPNFDLGPVGGVGGGFGNNLQQSSANDPTGGHGMIHPFRNALGQDQGQNQGQLTNRTEPVLHQHGIIHSQRNVVGQGQGQGQGQVSGAALDYGRYFGAELRRLRSTIAFVGNPLPPYNQVVVSSQHLGNTNIAPPLATYNQIVVSSQHLGHINIAPPVTSGFFIPRSVQQHNIRLWSHPNMPGFSFSQIFPSPNMPLAVVRPVGPAFLMPRSSTLEHNMGIMPNTNMPVRSGDERVGRIEQASERAEASSRHGGSDNRRDQDRQHDREHEHEQGSASRDAKRARR